MTSNGQHSHVPPNGRIGWIIDRTQDAASEKRQKIDGSNVAPHEHASPRFANMVAAIPTRAVRGETSMRWTEAILIALALLSLGCARGDWTTETLTLVDVTGYVGRTIPL